MKTQYLIMSAALSLTCLPLQSQAGTGEDTASAMTSYYRDTRPYCDTPSSPAFMCSGVILRATVPGANYYSWNPSPNSIASGGVSFSYLRADATFSNLAYGHDNGFTLFPYNFAPAGTTKPQVLCSFPIDAASEYRKDKGCGDNDRTQSTYVNGSIQYDRQERLCQDYAKTITTAEGWSQHYWWPAPEVVEGLRNASQCGFDVQENRSDRASAFFNSVRAVRYASRAPQAGQPVAYLPSNTQNELRLATWNTDDRLPIQSFFYLQNSPAGLSDAKIDQTDWFDATGKFVPIIAISLPVNQGANATFSYAQGDQAIAADTGAPTPPSVPDPGSGTPQTKCSTYIQSGEWINRFDPGLNTNAWTLAVTPTPCGRQIKDDQTNAAYAELLNKFGNDWQWTERNGGGMRRQLVCHLVIARDKPTWNLEPFRPNVSHGQSVAEGCNSVLQMRE